MTGQTHLTLTSPPESISPRRFLARYGEQGLARKLYTDGGYVIQQQTLWDLCESLESRIPLLPEGAPGSGKTALPEAVACAFKLKSFFLPCHEELTREELLYRFDTDEQNREIRYRIEIDGVARPQAVADKWTKRFLLLGEVLAAYEYSTTRNSPCVLTLDEVEKLRAAHEILLYEIFARHYAHIPGLEPSPLVGCILETDEPPLVFATSNNMRVGDKRGDKDSLSRPFRDRFIVTFCNTPTNEERCAILLAKVPKVSPALLAGVCKVAFEIERAAQIPSKPTLRNLIRCLESFVRGGWTSVEFTPFVRKLNYFAAEEKQRRNLGDMARFLVNQANKPHTQIDEWVARAFELHRAMQASDDVEDSPRTPSLVATDEVEKPICESAAFAVSGL